LGVSREGGWGTTPLRGGLRNPYTEVFGLSPDAISATRRSSFICAKQSDDHKGSQRMYWILSIFIVVACVIWLIRREMFPKSRPHIPNRSKLSAETFSFLGDGRPAHWAAPATDACERVKESAWAFMTASMALPMSSGRLDDAQKEIAAAYLWGVVDAISQKARLYDVDVVSIHLVLCLEFIEPSPEDAGKIAALGQGARLSPIAQIGGNAVLRFLSGTDMNAPLELYTLFAENRRGRGTDLPGH
jgi:hypothetical protein